MKKWHPPTPHPPPPTPHFQIYSLILAKNFIAPQVIQFSEGCMVLRSPFNKEGGGVPTMSTFPLPLFLLQACWSITKWDKIQKVWHEKISYTQSQGIKCIWLNFIACQLLNLASPSHTDKGFIVDTEQPHVKKFPYNQSCHIWDGAPNYHLDMLDKV